MNKVVCDEVLVRVSADSCSVCTGLSFYVGRIAADCYEGEISWFVSWTCADTDPDCASDWTPVCFLFAVFTSVDQFHKFLENSARPGGVCR